MSIIADKNTNLARAIRLLNCDVIVADSILTFDLRNAIIMENT
jgi:hypothetical protein